MSSITQSDYTKRWAMGRLKKLTSQGLESIPLRLLNTILFRGNICLGIGGSSASLEQTRLKEDGAIDKSDNIEHMSDALG